MPRFLALAGAAWLLAATVAPGQPHAEQLSQDQSQVATQIWTTAILDYPKDDRSLFELDMESRVQVSGSDKWRRLELTPVYEYYPTQWLDLTGELGLFRTHQFEGISTWEVRPRLGFRFEILGSLREREGTHEPLFPALARVRLATLLRYEYRNLYYSDGSPSSHSTRFRLRVETKAGINREDLSRDGTLYAMGDIEFFVPTGKDIPERYASKLRLRAGLGYRISYHSRVELLYIRDANRQTEQDPFAVSANSVDVRVKLFF